MNMYSFTEAFDHRRLSEELHETPWWQALMNDGRFLSAYERNYHMRLKLSDSHYIKKLLRSEAERQSFIDSVFHPKPEHLADLRDE